MKVRYLKVRDIASQGLLGEVKRTETGRYYVKKTSVDAWMRQNASDRTNHESE